MYIDYPGNPKACAHVKYGNLFPYHNQEQMMTMCILLDP